MSWNHLMISWLKEAASRLQAFLIWICGREHQEQIYHGPCHSGCKSKFEIQVLTAMWRLKRQAEPFLILPWIPKNRKLLFLSSC